METEELVKENKLVRAPLSLWWLVAALAANGLALAAVARIDHALPAPLGPDAPPERFHASTAHHHLVNLTSIGPRVAGSYENEVLAVSMLVTAIKRIAEQASPHNYVELDVHTASGAFSLSFMDGMNNVYRGVQSVVARVRGAGGRARGRSALLLNCHFDTVPDSPGASDDGAGCAVLLESMRALAAARRPLRHDAVFLLNGAEENILQASHAFITQHKWAKDVRAFINIEACGAGGREVLFQAGPHDPWIVEMYAGAVPYPFASSLAQELFESGLIPADTDFRIFRDFGKLSGVDLAWSANGYVYHTRLDTAERVPPAALQRTGDNVLALAHGLLASESLESELDESSRQPVFFDVLGCLVVSVRAPAALALSALTLALVALKIHRNATHARDQLFVTRAAWWRQVAGAALPAAQTWYLALGSLHMFVPIMGRAGAGALPADVTMALIVAALVQAACAWLLPLVQATRGAWRLERLAALACGAAALVALAGAPGAAYSAERPQRLMVFHTQRTVHSPEGGDQVDNFYWVPELDANTPHSVDKYVPELAGARAVSAEECARRVYCGAPYYLPVLSLIGASYVAPAPAAPLPRVSASLQLERLNDTALELSIDLTAGSVRLPSPTAGHTSSACGARSRLRAPASRRVSSHCTAVGRSGPQCRLAAAQVLLPGTRQVRRNEDHFTAYSRGNGRQPRSSASPLQRYKDKDATALAVSKSQGVDPLL